MLRPLLRQTVAKIASSSASTSASSASSSSASASASSSRAPGLSPALLLLLRSFTERSFSRTPPSPPWGLRLLLLPSRFVSRVTQAFRDARTRIGGREPGSLPQVRHASSKFPFESDHPSKTNSEFKNEGFPKAPNSLPERGWTASPPPPPPTSLSRHAPNASSASMLSLPKKPSASRDAFSERNSDMAASHLDLDDDDEFESEEEKTRKLLKRLVASKIIYQFLEKHKRFENAEHVFQYDYDGKEDPENDMEYEEDPSEDPDYDPEGGTFDLSQLKKDFRSAFEPDDRPRAPNPLPKPLSITELHELDQLEEYAKRLAFELGDYDPEVADLCIRCVDACLRKNRVEEALPFCKHLYKTFITNRFMHDPEYMLRKSAGEILLEFAELLMRLKRREDALMWALNSQEVLVAIPHESDEVETLLIAADTFVGFGFVWILRHDMAEKAFRSALIRQQKLLGEDHLFTALGQFNLGKALFKLGRLEEAGDLLRRCRATRIEQLGPKDHSSRIATETLMEITSKMGLLEETLELFTNFEGLGSLNDWVPEDEPKLPKKEKSKHPRYRKKGSKGGEDEEEDLEREENEREVTNANQMEGELDEDDVKGKKWDAEKNADDANEFETAFKLDLDLFQGKYSFDEVKDEEFRALLKKKEEKKAPMDGLDDTEDVLQASSDEGEEMENAKPRYFRPKNVKSRGVKKNSGRLRRK